MKTGRLLAVVLIVSLAFLGACGEKSVEEKGASEPAPEKVEKKEAELPAGYPAELTLPPGFKPSDLKTGSGSISGGGNGTRSYEKYELWKMMVSNAPEIIAHYKKLFTDLGYEGEWAGDGVNQSARGTFTKGLNEIEISISSETFDFKLKIFDK